MTLADSVDAVNNLTALASVLLLRCFGIYSDNMIGVIIQARMSSTRLPGKVLLSLAGKPVLQHVIERVKQVRGIDSVIVATTTETEDDAIADFCSRNRYSCFRGSRDDVLSRYFDAAQQFKIETIVRITSDCPLLDPSIITEVIDVYKHGKCDYVSNALPGERTFPRGLDCEVFSFKALEKACTEAREIYEREHVTPYIHENKTGEFRIGKMVEARGIFARPQYRLTLDYQEDYELISKLYDRFSTSNRIISVPDVIEFLDQNPNVAALNTLHEKEYPRQGIRK